MYKNNQLTEFDDHNHQDYTPVTLADVQTLATTCDQIMDTVSTTVGQVCTTVLEVKAITSQVEIETKRLEASLDALLIKAQRDTKLYESSLPLLDKQFTMYQQRMDKLMEKSIDMMTEDFSDEGLARNEAILKLIEMTNQGLNSLMSKLIPQY
jgi:hypothetical protein